jgi:beta-galactosidase
MRKKLLFSALAMACICSLASSPVAQGAIRISEDLSGGWRFLRTDAAGAESPDYQEGLGWQDVDLPHTWNTKDTFDDEPGYYRGIGWYRKSFAVPESWKGKRIVLRFEAACSVATAWVNGELLGQHKGSWTPFEFDIIDRVKPGSSRNLLAVRVDNRWRRDVPPHDMDFNIMGGLHREVFLIATDPVHIVSTRVTTPQVSDAEGIAAFEIEVRNETKKVQEYEVVTEIRGPGLSEPITLTSRSADLRPGETVLVKQRTKPIAKPKLWSPDEPNLYRVSFRLLVKGSAVDDAESPLGFRWYRFDADKGFFLNGKHLKLQGVNRHDDYPGLGWALPKSRQIKDVELIKSLGANFLRTVHYPQHPIVLDTCDKLGLLVWEEVPFDGEGFQHPPIVGAEDFARTLKQNLRDEIRRDRNHPSIILWSMGNENTGGRDLADWKAVAELTKQLHRIAKEEDPTRPTAVAINNPDRAMRCGLTKAVDILGYNIYAGWYSLRIEDFAEKVDEFHRWNPTKPLIISEYGAGMEKGRHSESPQRMDFSEEYGCRFHESYWRAIRERPFIAGSLIWNVFDFGVEWRGRLTKQSIPHLNQKGIFTYDRQPKDVCYFYRSQWTGEPMVYIVSHTWTKRKQGATSIKVYSNCDAVDLLLNGKSLGTKSKGETFLWDVPLGAGDNELRAEATRDGKHIVDALCIRCE